MLEDYPEYADRQMHPNLDEFEIDDRFDEDGEFDRSNFADPGGNSALRAATPSNPRIYPCPTCDRKNMLTPADIARHYQCDYCADDAERGY